MPNAIITGATQGIGKAISEKLLAEGFDIAICARTKSDLEKLQKQWKKTYPKAKVIIYKADFAQKKEVIAFAKHVLSVFKKIDILVNNAGIFYPGKLADEEEGHLEELMAVHLFSAYHLTRHVLPIMKKKKTGHIFNMCSIASLRAYPSGGSYGISKYALLGFSENLRYELKDDGIKVTAICPGAVYTSSWAGSGLPESRFIKAEDVANALWAAYTLSDSADLEMIVIRPQKGDI
jgi:short-subunit dehydrogenase